MDVQLGQRLSGVRMGGVEQIEQGLDAQLVVDAHGAADDSIGLVRALSRPARAGENALTRRKGFGTGDADDGSQPSAGAADGDNRIGQVIHNEKIKDQN